MCATLQHVLVSLLLLFACCIVARPLLLLPILAL
jgi:hypothetical protein